jgi:hypothetical protein
MFLPDYLHHLYWLPVAVAAYFLIALYIYAPMKIRRQQVRDVTIECNPIELAQLPGEVATVFQSASQDLASCGFQAVGHGHHSVPQSRQDSYVSIWANHQLGDSAQVIGICTPWPTGNVRTVTLVTFRTEYTGQTSIVTSNSSSSGIYPVDPRIQSIRCPGIWDLPLLYQFHRARVDRDSRGRQPTLARVTPPETRLQLEQTETFERLIRAGYYSLDQTQLYYIPTWKGAYLMTYKLLPPFKQIQKMRKDAACDRELKELGFGGTSAFRAKQLQA